MTVEGMLDEPSDQFPIGMRVLAVDDDPICLKLLEALLRRCQYHVTITSRAITALELLRDNKKKFDLVISDVHMPDMDGFKLLEHVGLEMDLPVIMLSANGDTRLVMKGITHGACDYLLKPVRIEQLKNIWQHVIRRKKVDPKDQTNYGNEDKAHGGSGEGGLGSVGMGNSDQNLKQNRKRKDQEEEDYDDKEDEFENDDPSTQKKPRVVWSPELHRKFVAAVNQLGIDKAVPKKILDLMNVEKLTRENVASHLQKYRLYLKRISLHENQQANMVAALRTHDSSYFRTNAFTGNGQFHTNAYRSLPPTGMIGGRLNTPAGQSLHCLPSPGMFQLGYTPISNNPINDRPVICGNRTGNVLPAQLELDQHHRKGATGMRDLSAAINGTTAYPISSGLLDAKPANRSNDAAMLTENPILRHPGESEVGRNYVNQSSVSRSSLNSEFSPPFLDHSTLNDNWSSAAHPSMFRSNSFSSRDSFKQPTLLLNNSRDNMPVTSSLIGGSQMDGLSINSISGQPNDSRIGLQTQASPISNTSGQTINNGLFQGWDHHKQDSPYHSDLMCSSMNSLMPINDTVAPFDPSFDSKTTTFQRNTDFSSIAQSHFLDPVLMRYDEVEIPTMEASLNLKQGYLMDQRRPQGGYIPSNVGQFDDLELGGDAGKEIRKLQWPCRILFESKGEERSLSFTMRLHLGIFVAFICVSALISSFVFRCMN